MKQFKTYFRFICTFALISLVLIQYGCQKDEEGNNVIIKEKINGFVQKGPYVNGSSINIYELDNSLNQTGNGFNTQIIDNKGTFEISNIELTSQYAEFKADGFYFDEVKGEKSSAQLTLYALSDITDKSTINVNILTQLEYGRVKKLVEEGLSFKNAKDSAQKEVLLMFGYTKDDMNNSELLDISVNEEENAILLAISVILQANLSVADLTELIANINTDIREDGVLNSDIIKSSLLNRTRSMYLPDIRKNLETRYSELGVEANIPYFEQKIADYLVSEQPFEIEAITKDPTCYGFSNGSIDVTINGGTAPYTYSWSNGKRTQDLEGLTAGKYYITVTDDLNYSLGKKITVSEPEKISVSNSISNPSPEGNNGEIDLTVSGGTAPYNFNWNNGETTEDINDLSSAWYHVTVTDNNSCEADFDILVYGKFTDEINETDYETIKIGNQIWMAENLKSTKYADGTEINYLTYNNDESLVDTYGRLYSWGAMMNGATSSIDNPSGVQGACPDGWHVPSNEEWKQLEMFLGMTQGDADSDGWRGTDEGRKLISSSGFRAVMAGKFDGAFKDLNYSTYYWSATQYNSNYAWRRYLYYHYDRIHLEYSKKYRAFSVRCVKD